MSEHEAPGKKAAADTAAEGLSQLIARILKQLAISAWLPAAALVLLLAFVVHLGQVLDKAKTRPDWFDAVTTALQSMGNMTAGSFFLMLAGVIVLTMLTQAFTFDAIRVLEGYWGAFLFLEPVAGLMSAYHRWRLGGLERRLQKVTEKAWDVAEPMIYREIAHTRELTTEMVQALAHRVTGQGDDVNLTDDEDAVIDRYDWSAHSRGELLRRKINLEKRLNDYPIALHMRPTRLGNVLRRWEDETGVLPVESLVDDRYGQLPFSLRVAHDEQRGQLDLYCSMTFVWLVVGATAFARFRGFDDYEPYAWWLLGISLFGAWFTYRAAIASARYYGSLLVTIAPFPTQREILAQAAQES